MELINPLKLPYKSIGQVIKFVKHLRSKGLQQGIDFEFVTCSSQGFVTFYFKEAKYVTFYAIQYQPD